jgi:hypothetical protein
LPPPTNTEKIDELIKSTAILQENLATFRRDFDEFKVDREKVKSQLNEHIKQVTRIEEGLKHIEKELDKLRSNRFEVGKVFLAAFFSFMGAGIFFLLNVLSQWLLKLK